MILFKTLTYKNFLSCGNNPITIQLDKSKSTLIVGANGSGKSTILDALSFALFGKAHRNVSKPLLVNAVNGKHCEVSIVFEEAGHEFKIVRGIKPNIFEVWQDGDMIYQSA
jgi:DNA repair exonuclease SbcCD ATPase subunit